MRELRNHFGPWRLSMVGLALLGTGALLMGIMGGAVPLSAGVCGYVFTVGY